MHGLQYVTLGKAVREIQDAHPGQYGVRPRLLTWGYFAVEILSLTLQVIHLLNGSDVDVDEKLVVRSGFRV